MFVKDCWYVAALAREVGRSLFARTIAGEQIILYRSEAGQPVAMLDRCPHRLVPLSAGTLVGDSVQCGYHGITFDCSGRCVRIPGEHQISPKFRSTVFPCVERWGFVWVWLGNAELADESRLPQDFHWGTEPGWTPLSDRLRVEGNYQLLVDNLLDLSHEAFLHMGTIGNAAVAETPAETTIRGDLVQVARFMKDCAPPKLFVRAAGFTTNIDRTQRILYTPPCYVVIEVRAVPTGTNGEERKLAWWVLNALTPETERTTHYFWGLPRGFAHDDTELTEMLRAGIFRTFEEDRVMIEAQQRILDRVSLDTRTVYTKADQAPGRARSMVSALIAQEERARTAATDLHHSAP